MRTMKAYCLCSLSDPPTMAGVIVLGMTGGHDERVERGGRGGSEAVRSGRHYSYTKTARNALASHVGVLDSDMGFRALIESPF